MFLFHRHVTHLYFRRLLRILAKTMDEQPSATMMMGYLYMVGSEEKMGITPDFAKAEQVSQRGRGGKPW